MKLKSRATVLLICLVAVGCERAPKPETSAKPDPEKQQAVHAAHFQDAKQKPANNPMQAHGGR